MLDQFGYIFISLGILPLWLLIYVKAKRLRLRMRNSGIYGGVIAILTEPLFVQDYWEPPVLLRIQDSYFLEDFTYAFLYTGVAIAIYNFLFHIEYKTEYEKKKKASLIITVLAVLSLVIFNMILGFNSLFVIVVGLIVGAIVMIVLRPDLLFPSLVSAMLMMLISLVIYIIIFNTVFTTYWQDYWKLTDSVYGYYVFNTPWTEHLWHFALGLYVSIVYDFASGTSKKSGLNISFKK